MGIGLEGILVHLTALTFLFGALVVDLSVSLEISPFSLASSYC